MASPGPTAWLSIRVRPFQTWKRDDGNLVDFVVSADCFKQDKLFLCLWISYELKYNAVFEINRTGPGTCQVPLQFMSMKGRMICIFTEKFQCIFNLILQIRPAPY